MRKIAEVLCEEREYPAPRPCCAVCAAALRNCICGKRPDSAVVDEE